MSDLIKREDAIGACAYETIECYEARKAIRALPSADRPKEIIAQITFDEEKLREIVKEAVERFKEEYEIVDRPQEWIPCSDRLPEEKEVVAVIIKRWDTGEIKKGITYRVDHNMWVGFGRHNEACVWWLPLPPWKGADDE